MLRTRVLTSVVALPLAIALVALGGVWLFALLAVLFTLATVEFCQMMRRDGYRPNAVLALPLLWLLLAEAQLEQWGRGSWLLGPGVCLALMISLSWQLGHREGKPVVDWALTVGGALYVGWLGAYLIRLRGLPDGLWWVLASLASIWIADSGAYVVGRRWGRHKMAPTLSPGKTWEGYWGGVVTGMLGAVGLIALWRVWAGPVGPTLWQGCGLALLISTLAPLGDLVVSMFKRQVGVKDTGTLFPGHGGALDRIDSVLWAGVIGYYFALAVGAIS